MELLSSSHPHSKPRPTAQLFVQQTCERHPGGDRRKPSTSKTKGDIIAFPNRSDSDMHTKTERVCRQPSRSTHTHERTARSSKPENQATRVTVSAQHWRTIVSLLSDQGLSSGANNVSHHSAETALRLKKHDKHEFGTRLQLNHDITK